MSGVEEFLNAFFGKGNEHHLRRLQNKISTLRTIQANLEGDKYSDEDFDKMIKMRNELDCKITRQINELWIHYLLLKIQKR